ncbi:endogenous retrovirus group K member 7 Gag polyprotein-like [Eumetopias jubatus]|uniref:endogenous retrovirus group K member 7 Gag polyprotein-like n=1 Tax=Eumetopias jubatus TaxID=34886 RepID=UPI001016F8E2|nr:endogenous retrovirus group K member 7 Gag polyprotein-like [Eumetopias jubatus]
MGLWSHICEILEPQQKIELISLKSWVEDEEKDPIKVPLTPTGVSSFEILGDDVNLPAQDPFPPPPPPMPLAGKAPKAQSGGDEFGDDDVYLDDDPILTMPTSLKSVLPAVTASGQGINSVTKCTQTSTLQAFPIMTNQQSAAKSPVSGISPLQRTLLTAQQAGEDVGEFNAYPAEFEEKCNNLAIYNKRTQIPVTYEMLAGTGAYYEVGNQIHFPEIAYVQINEAVLTAWKKLPTTGSRTEELSKIRQGPDERYQDFVSRLLQAVSRIVVDGEAGTIIVKQLAFENANSACQAAIRPWKSTGTLEDFLRLCADIGPSYVQGVTLAAALRGIPPQQLHTQLLKKQKGKSPMNSKARMPCFLCGELGHFRNECPKGSRQAPSFNFPSGNPPNKPQPPSVCPRCMRGRHWANECRSKTDRFGRPLQQGNSQRGFPQPHQTIAAMLSPPSLRSEPTRPTSLGLNPFTEAPQPVQD